MAFARDSSSRSELENGGIRFWKLESGLVCDFTEGAFPTTIRGWSGGEMTLPGLEGATHFGVVHSGTLRLECANGSFALAEGMYFAIPVGRAGANRARIDGNGRGFLVTSHHHFGLFHIGGPIESRGRLRYIDGCTDTLLIPPVVQGDPCLNLLHIPPKTHQTRHTHPSLRAGLIVRGRGTCVTPSGETPLEAGLAFAMPKDTAHAFHTEGDELLLLAYHPDSDTGPSHRDHPMVNRTMVGGVSASEMPDILTRSGRDPAS